MFDAYEYARKYIKISKLMDECMHTMKVTQYIIDIGSGIKMNEFGNQMDVLYYNDYPVLDHKISWVDEIFGYNFVSKKPITTGAMVYKDVIIVDTKTNIFYDTIQSVDSVQYSMEFLDVEEHLFQMQLLLNERFDLYSILHALHMLGYDNRAFMYFHSLNILDKIIDAVEIYLDNHRYNKEF